MFAIFVIPRAELAVEAQQMIAFLVDNHYLAQEQYVQFNAL
jgi:hypothetical protein